MSDEKTKPLSIKEQAYLIEEIVSRCLMHDGSVSDENTMTMKRGDVEKLMHLAARLHRIAPFEDAIRRVVTGR